MSYSMIHFCGDFPLVEYPLAARAFLMLGFFLSTFIQAIPLGLIGQHSCSIHPRGFQGRQASGPGGTAKLAKILQFFGGLVLG